MKSAKVAWRAVAELRAGSLVIAFTAVLMGLAAPARAQADYPNRPVQLIIAYGAGTVGDVSMRILAEKLSSKLGKNFVVENRPGAAGVIAAKAAATAAPDGYTLFLVGNSYAISTALFKSLPYDVLKDFAPISAVATFDFLVVTRKDSKFKSMQDIISYAKANPGKLNIATLSPGTTQYLAVELLKVAAGDKQAVRPTFMDGLARGHVGLARRDPRMAELAREPQHLGGPAGGLEAVGDFGPIGKTNRQRYKRTECEYGRSHGLRRNAAQQH